MSLLDTISQAIATQEGYYKPGTLAQRNNNPGNLVMAPWESQYGVSAGAGGYAAFPSSEAGFAAAQDRIQQLIDSGSSLTDLVHTWASTSPAAEQEAYIQSLAQATQLDPSKPISLADPSGSGTGAGTSNWQSLAGAALSAIPGFGFFTPAVAPDSIQSNWTVRSITIVVGLVIVSGALLYFAFGALSSAVEHAGNAKGAVTGTIAKAGALLA